MKTCTSCRERKIYAAFYTDRSRPDGYSSQCKDCKYLKRAGSTVTAQALRQRENAELRKQDKLRCSQCQEIKVWSTDFYEGELRCKSCCSRRSVDYVRRTQRGWTQEEYEKAHADQNGKCAICGSVEKLVGDHDHLTGKARALLCGECNLILGKAKDDPGRLRAAAAYLEGWASS